MAAHSSAKKRCGWCHQPIPPFVRRMYVTLALPDPPAAGSEIEDLVIDGHPVTAIVPEPGSFYASKGNAMVVICGEACRQGLDRAVANDARAYIAAHQVPKKLAQRMAEGTVRCSWCKGELPTDRLPYLAPLKLPPAPELADRVGTSPPLRLSGAFRHGYIAGLDPVTQEGLMVFVLCSTACGSALRAGLVDLHEREGRKGGSGRARGGG